MTTGTPIRLQKYLARAGVLSRRKSADLITAGHIQVNGQTIKEPFFRLLLGVDEVRNEGALLSPAKPVYYKLYKPVKVLSAMGDDGRYGTLSTLLPPDMTRVFPVGRLDYDAEGILLITNDGDLSNLLLHPRYHVEKKYLLTLRPCPSRSQMRRLEHGIELDGRMTKPSVWELLERNDAGKEGIIKVTLTEGRKNQLKRMADAVHSHVKSLKREQFGPILLGHMRPGQLKKLAPGEIAALMKLADAARSALAGVEEGDGEGDED